MLYTLSSSALILKTLRTFYKLCAFPRRTGDVPRADLVPPKIFLNKSIPFECASREGELPVCNKDNCNGRWKAPRMHHCSQCGVCKAEWDHHVRRSSPLSAHSGPCFLISAFILNSLLHSAHGYVEVCFSYSSCLTLVSPWNIQIGNCVSQSQSAPFLHLLFLTPLTIAVSALPVLRPVYQHFRAALRIAMSDTHIKADWWDWKWSWIVWGGPIGRYVRGLVLGYRVLQKEYGGSGKAWGDVVREPRAALAATLLCAILLGVFTMVRENSFYLFTLADALVVVYSWLNMVLIFFAHYPTISVDPRYTDVAEHITREDNARRPQEPIQSSS